MLRGMCNMLRGLRSQVLRVRETSPVSISDGAQHRVGLIKGEVGEGHFLSQMLTVELGEPVRESWTNLIATVGQQDKKRRTFAVPRQIQQKFQARLIAPMDILHDEQQGVCSCLLQEKTYQDN